MPDAAGSRSDATGTPLLLSVLPERLAVCRFTPDTGTPAWATAGEFFSVTRAADGLSVVCPEERVPAGVKCERGWRALRVEGPLDFSLVGVLSSLAAPLAESGVSIFAISTYETDYVLVRSGELEVAVTALRESGYQVRDADSHVVARPATPEDEWFLWEMLYEAVYWGPEESGPKPPPEKLLEEPGLRRYLVEWGRANDFAVVACDADGRRVGAAWYRTFPASDPGYGFVDAGTPDIAIAVAANRRGKGVGGVLLRALMNAAVSDGFDAVSLSVQKSNHAAIRLYEKNGFVRLRDDGNAWVMMAQLLAHSTTNDAWGA